MRRAHSLPKIDGDLVGAQIRLTRRAAGITLASLGQRCGMAPSVLSLIETGRRTPKLATVVSIARGLEVDVAELFAPLEPSARLAREIAWRHVQQSDWYQQRGLPRIRTPQRLPDDVLEVLLGLYAAIGDETKEINPLTSGENGT